MAQPTAQGPSTAAPHTPCPSQQPVDALHAWQSVFRFDPLVPRDQYLNSWQATNAFQGLNRARPPQGSTRSNDPKVKLPSSVKDNYTIQETLRQIQPADAPRRACVRLYGGGPGWDQKVQKEFNEGVRCPDRGQDCYGVNEDGLFESAHDLAKKAYSKEHAPHVQPGYCLSTIGVHKNNAKNRARFATTGETEQSLYNYIAALEARILQLSGETRDSCSF